MMVALAEVVHEVQSSLLDNTAYEYEVRTGDQFSLSDGNDRFYVGYTISHRAFWLHGSEPVPGHLFKNYDETFESQSGVLTAIDSRL